MLKILRKIASKRSGAVRSLLLLSALVAAPNARAQNAVSEDTAKLTPVNFYLDVGVAGFMPFKESYRLNYSTRAAGLPLEIMGGLSFPVLEDLHAGFMARYTRRVANFVSDMKLEALAIEPGVQYFIEKNHDRDLRLFVGSSLILQRSIVAATIDVSKSGSIEGTEPVEKNYYDLGLGLQIGLSYPITQKSALDFSVHAGLLFANSVEHGGLGNIGGLSIGLIYRLGI